MKNLVRWRVPCSSLELIKVDLAKGKPDVNVHDEEEHVAVISFKEILC